MELSAFDVIKKQVVTMKSVKEFRALNRVTFYVHRQANKHMIKDAIEQIWDVKVAKVRIINKPSKNKTFARRPFETAARKKALVELKQGYTLVVPGMTEIANKLATQASAGDHGANK